VNSNLKYLITRKEIAFVVFLIIAGSLWVWFLVSNHAPVIPTVGPEIARLKSEITQLKTLRNSQITKHDTIEKIQIKYRTKYLEVRHDSLTPCPEKLAYCDTLVLQDSALLAQKDSIIGLDMQIISKQDSVIHTQDLTISDLTKSVKKERRRKRIWAAVAAIMGGIAVAR
jgi:hypothetical protein